MEGGFLDDDPDGEPLEQPVDEGRDTPPEALESDAVDELEDY